MNTRAYFLERRFGVETAGRNVLLEHQCANFLITCEYFDDLAKNFQSIVRKLGDYVAGDEKLDYFTGNSGYIRKVPNKPAKIGLWHYQLVVAKIVENTPYILDLKMAQIHKQANESEMANIVERWSEAVNKDSKRETTTALVFDTHYMDSVSRTVLIKKKIKYIGAVSSGRFGQVFDFVKQDISKPGDFCGVLSHNE
jgi:NADH:ubiquinone oxidoreductase subunit F (NADH-binding)